MEASQVLLRSRRDATAIIHDILAAVKRRPSKTKLVYNSNMNFRVANIYIRYLLKKDLIREYSDDQHRITYDLTKRGESLLDLLTRLEHDFLEYFSL